MIHAPYIPTLLVLTHFVIAFALSTYLAWSVACFFAPLFTVLLVSVGFEREGPVAHRICRCAYVCIFWELPIEVKIGVQRTMAVPMLLLCPHTVILYATSTRPVAYDAPRTKERSGPQGAAGASGAAELTARFI